MNSSDKPEFSKRWWKSEKPDEIRGSDLGKALGAAEKALAQEERKPTESSIDDCLLALNDLGSVVERTIKKECDRAKHRDVISVLEKFDRLIQEEVERLQKARLTVEDEDEDDEDDEDEEESEGKLFERDHLCKMIKRVRNGGELNFCFGLDKSSPENSCLLLNPRGKPETLLKMMKRTGRFSNRLMTYGHATADPDNPKTLLFRLVESADEPPQILKLSRQFLRSDRTLQFRKIKIVLPGGESIEDTDDEDRVS
jgi:hypothetical protein